MLPDLNPIATDTALVLRWFPVTDTSRIVVWFTLEHGKVSTLIKGSQRSKSWTLGQFDLFYTCELLFYTRAREDLHLFRECSPLTPRPSLRSNWRNTAAASFIVDMLYRLSPAGAAAPELFHLADSTLDLLNITPATPQLLFWVELQVYRILGIEPQILETGTVPVFFDYRNGRAGTKAPNTESAVLTPGVRAVFQHLLQTDTPETLGRLRLLPEQIQEISRHLDRFSQWHLDQPLPSRHHALHWILYPAVRSA